MTNSLKKKLKEKKSIKSELIFENFCKDHEIIYKKIDDPINGALRKKLLKQKDGKCPDFWCKKDTEEIFVEVKTLTNFTNKKREDSIDQAIKEMKQKGLSICATTELFNPISELIGPFTTFLKDSSNKFKNIKDDLNFPRILFINGVSGNMEFQINAIFSGSYNSYIKKGNELINVGFRKSDRGLFDKTGSNVSAIIYLDNELDFFKGTTNPKAKFPFTENIFEIFFGQKK